MTVVTDHLGFALVFVEAIDAWLTMLPITKVQYEYYLCDRRADRRLNNQWYTDRLQQNPRTSANKLASNNYFNAFMTSVTTEEADWYIQWMFECMCQEANTVVECRLPTDDEWKHTYRELRELPAQELTTFPSLNPRAFEIAQRLNILMRQPQAAVANVHLRVEAAQPRTYSVADQMLLHRGVYEWVSHGMNGHGGRGAPPSIIGGGHMDPTAGTPLVVNETDRHPYFGFRVLVKGQIASS